MNLNKIMSMALVLGVLWSCEKEETEVSNAGETTPETTATVTKNFRGTLIEVEPLGDGQYSNGDMVFSEDQFLPNDYDTTFSEPGTGGKLATGGRIQKWPNNTVVYEISNLSQTLRTRFQQAMDEWSTKTNVRFKQRTNERNFVRVRQNDGCNCGVASLGVQRSGFISLGARASVGVIVHEIGHTLGFIHEQNRADRDQYIDVRFEAISSSGRNQYFVDSRSRPQTSQLDYKSIMMYKSTTFALNFRVPTMVRKDNGQPVEGFGGSLTALDIQGTNNAYPSANPPNPNPPTPTGKCDGVEEWQRGRRYFNGDKVTFRGNLFEAINFRWVNQGPCNE